MWLKEEYNISPWLLSTLHSVFYLIFTTSPINWVLKLSPFLILLSHKKEWNNVTCSNMDGPRDDHTKWSRSDKDKYHMISLVCGIWNIIQMNLFTKQEQTHRHRKQTYGYQRGKGVGEG